MTDAGIPSETLAPTFFSFAAPARTSAPIIQRLNAELNRALTSADVSGKLTGIGLIPKPGTPEDAVRTVTADIARFRALAASIGLKPE